MIREMISLVLNMSITASLIIPGVLLARFLLRKAPKVFSYALWGIVLFRLLCPVSFSAPFSAFNLLDLSAETTGEMRYFSAEGAGRTENGGLWQDAFGGAGAGWQTDLSMEPMGQSTGEAPGDDLQQNMQQKPQNVSLPISEIGENAQNVPGMKEETGDLRLPETSLISNELTVTVIALIWGLGIVCLAAFHLISYLRIRAKVSCCIRLRGRIYLTDEITTPFCMGIFRPRIYLPSGLGREEREYIILHEQHHIRRGDHVMKLIAFAALCIHWFNPLVWLAFVLAGRDMEMSCDEAVMRRMTGDIRAAYSASLLNLATGRKVLTISPLAFGNGDPKQRIKNVMNYKKPSFWALFLAMLLCLTVTAAFAANPKSQEDEAAKTQGEGTSHIDNPSEETSGKQDAPIGSEVEESEGKQDTPTRPEVEKPGLSLAHGADGESPNVEKQPEGTSAPEQSSGAFYEGKTPKEVYRKIADSYYRAREKMKETRETDEALAQAGGAYICEEFLAASGQKSAPVYLLYDLNGDGTDEFFMGLRFDYETLPPQYIIYDVYTWKDGRACQLMQEIGYRRGTCEIMKGGVIRDCFSGSAWDFGCYYRVLPQGGTSLETVDAQWASANDSGSSDYFDGGGNRITQEQYQAIWDQYEPEELSFAEYDPEGAF